MAADEIEALRQRVSRNPGGGEFPALADALRRSGDPAAAVDAALRGLEHAGDNVAGRVALALARLDLGDAEAARADLAQVMESTPGWLPDVLVVGAEPSGRSDLPADVGEAELDAAFEAAETNASEMIDVNDIAERAMEQLAGDADIDLDPDGDADDGFAALDHPAFATATMAGLLERQGDHDTATAIRTALGKTLDAAVVPERTAQVAMSAPDTFDRDAEDHRAQTLATLERWLANIRRGAR